MLRHTVAGAITFYQHSISPHKGFCCAYRACTGRRSCSAYAKTLVLRLGVLSLVVGMKRQFARCRAAYQTLMTTNSERDERRRKIKSCAGDGLDAACDLSCDNIPCDVPCDCSF